MSALSSLLVSRKTFGLAALDGLMVLSALVLSAAATRVGTGFSLLTVLAREWKGATVIALSVHLLAFYVFELYNLRLDFRRLPNLLRCVGAVATAAVVLAVSSYVVPRWGLGRRLFALHAVLLTVGTVVSRVALSRLIALRAPPDRALVVTGAPISSDVIDELAHNPESPFDIVGIISVGRPSMIFDPLHADTPAPVSPMAECATALQKEGARHLLVANLDQLPAQAAQELLRLKGEGIHVHELASIYQALSGRVPLHLVDDLYFLRVAAFTRDTNPVLSNLLRVFDVLVALALYALSWPLWILAYVGIKLTMPGPALYSQERVGKDEVPYTIYKFRSMRMDAEKDGPRWATQNDDRVTPFGRFLRRTRIDELPQLWNVLRGDMSLVGPRPERAVFVSQLSREVPYYSLRFQIRPGLTGWAQVNYRYGASVDDTRVKLSYDLFYIQGRSLSLFAVTLLKTVQTVLFKPGS
ncbi:MAG: exopolysaccharide biosynthesis polyprenyl glycosylphosphotransferase [Myxococcaceae bacterium]|nr:exopolysaccharide biosynthesis polyprenyl glycosylphosphotransferase [Myxococcaceae bacterium]